MHFEICPAISYVMWCTGAARPQYIYIEILCLVTACCLLQNASVMPRQLQRSRVVPSLIEQSSCGESCPRVLKVMCVFPFGSI